MVKQKKKVFKKSEGKKTSSSLPSTITLPSEPISSQSSTLKKKKNSSVIQKKKKQTTRSNPSSKKEDQLSSEMFEKLNSIIVIDDLENNGFSENLWKSLSIEEKLSIPIFISMKFRLSSTRNERKENEKKKRILHGIVLKYHKNALHQFYLLNKKKIKKMKEESSISGNKATDMLWNQLSLEEKNAWYNQCSFPSENSQVEEVTHEDDDVHGDSSSNEDDN